MNENLTKRDFWRNPLVWLIIAVVLVFVVFAGIGWYYQFRSAAELSETAQRQWLNQHQSIPSAAEIVVDARFLKQGAPKAQPARAESLAELQKLSAGK